MSSPSDLPVAPPGAPPGAPRPPLPRRWRLAASLFVALSLWVMAQMVAESEESRAFMRERATRVLAGRLGPVEVGAASVDWAFRARLRDVRVLPARAGDPVPVAIAEVRMRPRALPLLSGRVEPAAVTLEGVTVDLGRGTGELERIAKRLGGDRSRAPATGRASDASRARQRAPAVEAAATPPGRPEAYPALHVVDLRILLPRRPDRPDTWVGPLDADLAVERDGPATRGRAALRLPGGGSADVELARGDGKDEIRLDAHLVLPDDLPAEVVDRLPVRPSGGAVRVVLEAHGEAGLRSGTASLVVTARDLSVEGRAIGAEAAGPLRGAVDLSATWSAGGSRLAIPRGRISVGDASDPTASASATLTAELSLHAAPEPPALAFEVRADEVSWTALLAALPPGLRPPPAAPQAQGTFSFFLRARGRPGRPGWDVAADLDIEGMRRATRAGGAQRLAEPFTWRPTSVPAGQSPRDVEVGPGNPRYVPLAALPAHVPRAITASEDGRFFTHRGFEFAEMAVALSEQNGKRLRGASTISQQLAKNLFLSGDRTLTRKIREALATVALEAALPKARMMEIYLNIIEWGPNVYGVGEAAPFWFGKDARELTPREAAFLASVIPAPRRFHAGYHRVGMTPWWRERVDTILGRMYGADRPADAGAEEVREDVTGALTRKHPADPAEPEPPPEEGEDPDGT